MDAKLVGQSCGRGPDLLLVEVQQDDVRTVTGELTADLDSHAAKGTGHGADLPLKIEPVIHFHPSDWLQYASRRLMQRQPPENYRCFGMV